MTSEEQNLLRKAVADPKGQIAIKRTRRGAWHPDRDRLDVLRPVGIHRELMTAAARWIIASKL